MALTKFRIVNAEGLGSIRTPAGEFILSRLTDEQAAQLHARGSRYIEKVEPPAPKPRKKSSKKV